MAVMPDPDRNTQHKRGHNWFPEEPKKPPPDDARQRRPEGQQGAAPVANSSSTKVSSMDPRRESRTPDKSPGTKKHAVASRLKTAPRQKRRQPSFERVVKIARRFLAPERRP